jgi:hypothetical protein
MGLNFRWFATCDEHGCKTEPTLQVWDADWGCWRDVPYLECKDHEEVAFRNQPPEV